MKKGCIIFARCKSTLNVHVTCNADLSGFAMALGTGLYTIFINFCLLAVVRNGAECGTNWKVYATKKRHYTHN